MKKRRAWRVISIIFLLFTLICFSILIMLITSGGGDVDQYKVDTEEKTENPIDWDALQKINPNIYAWVCVPGTDIDYPVLQSDDNQEEDYYLHQNIYNQYSFAGSIYSRKDNAKDFEDPVTVLYGHNMLNGSMFGSVKKFEDATFFTEHKKMYIYTPDRIMTYKIVAYYIADKSDLLDKYEPETKKGYKKYRKAVKQSSGNKRKNISLTAKDKMVTLSTCSPTGTARRLLQCVRTDVTWND